MTADISSASGANAMTSSGSEQWRHLAVNSDVILRWTGCQLASEQRRQIVLNSDVSLQCTVTSTCREQWHHLQWTHWYALIYLHWSTDELLDKTSLRSWRADEPTCTLAERCEWNYVKHMTFFAFERVSTSLCGDVMVWRGGTGSLTSSARVQDVRSTERRGQGESGGEERLG